MSRAEILQELAKLEPEERREVRAKLNDLEDSVQDTWLDGTDLTDDEKVMLDLRLAEYEENPDEGGSCEEVAARVRRELAK